MSHCLSVNNRNTRTRRGIFSKLIIRLPERRRIGFYIANFEHILHTLVFISWVCIKVLFPILSVNNYLFKVNNQNTRVIYKIWMPR